jgi:Spy/CpxP family protein refolding chaperone
MKASLFAAVLLCAAGVAAAQAPAPNPHNAAAWQAKRMDRLATLLDLNDGQKAQVQTVLQEERAKAMQTFQQAKASGTRPTPDQMRTTHQQLKAETLQKLSTVLTESQLKKFQILEEDHHPHGFRHHGGPPPAAPASSSGT